MFVLNRSSLIIFGLVILVAIMKGLFYTAQNSPPNTTRAGVVYLLSFIPFLIPFFFEVNMWFDIIFTLFHIATMYVFIVAFTAEIAQYLKRRKTQSS